MPQTNGHAPRKTSVSTTPRPRSRRRVAQPSPVPPAPQLPEDFPAHATLLPPPPEAPYSLPAPPEADDPGDTPRVASLPAGFSQAWVEELRALWPDLQALAHWWQALPRLAQQDEAPDCTLTRQTYPIEPCLIDAVQREAARTGENPAALINRALVHYFAGR